MLLLLGLEEKLLNVMNESHEEEGDIFSYHFLKWNCHKIIADPLMILLNYFLMILIQILFSLTKCIEVNILIA